MSAIDLSKASKVAGIASIVVLLGVGAAVVLAETVPFELTAPAFILGQLVVATWFTVVGFKTGVKWMILWLLAFFLFFPPATVIFWFVNRHREFRVMGKLAR